MEKQDRHSATMSRRSVLRTVALCGVALLATGCGGREEDVIEEEPAVEPEEVVVSDTTTANPEPVQEPASEFARMLQVGEVSSIRVIGDSMTEGFGCDGCDVFTDNVIYEGSYGTFFEADSSVRCWTNAFREYANSHAVANFVNAGISGAKMRWLYEEPEAWIREGADVIFVMLGTNDAVYHGVDEFREFSESALMAASEHCKHLVVLAPPNNAWTDYEMQMGMDEVEQTLRDVSAAHDWTFVSLYDVIALGTDMVNEDQCHPTTKGSMALWERVVSELGL